MEKNNDCTEMVIAEERIRIGHFKKKGFITATRFLDASGRTMTACKFKEGERVVLEGVVLKDGSIMAYSIQKIHTGLQ